MGLYGEIIFSFSEPIDFLPLKTTLLSLNRSRFAARTFTMDLPNTMVEYNSASHQQCPNKTHFVYVFKLMKKNKESNTQQQDNKGSQPRFNRNKDSTIPQPPSH